MPVTVKNVIDIILATIPNNLTENTVDTLKSGDPQTPVTGIVTTFIASLDVLQRARDIGANMVITHEPTFYDHLDNNEKLDGNPILEYKRRFLKDNGISVWRFHDNWHRHQPDGIITGVIRQLGWEKWQTSMQPVTFTLPETTVRELAKLVKEKLGGKVVRVTGDPDMACTKVALLVGAPGSLPQMYALQLDDVEVVIGGEAPEWETCEYTRDAIAAGMKKALIMAGHCNTEEGGMEYLAEWLQPKVPDVKVNFIPAGDPFWTI